MQFAPHLNFNGQCEAAFKFYEKCLGGKIRAMFAYAGTPAESQVPAEWRDKVLHAMLVVGDQVLMGCDVPPSHYQAPSGFSVAIQLNDAAASERIFNALAENGKISMPFQQTFWAAGFGMLVDRFGIPSMVNCEQAVQQQAAR